MITGYAHPFAAFFDRTGFAATYDPLLPTSATAPMTAGGKPPRNGGHIGHSPKAA